MSYRDTSKSLRTRWEPRGVCPLPADSLSKASGSQKNVPAGDGGLSETLFNMCCFFFLHVYMGGYLL